MVKTVLSVSHQGLRDWIYQRLTAIVMAVYSVGLIYFFLTNEVTYFSWHELFVPLWMKVATLLFLGSFLIHAWIGMWTVYTDYIKPVLIRSILNTITIIALIAFFFEGILILWSV